MYLIAQLLFTAAAGKIKGWELCNIKCGFELLQFEMNTSIDATQFISKESRVLHLLFGGSYVIDIVECKR